jgi:cysteine-rich repeat protein
MSEATSFSESMVPELACERGFEANMRSSVIVGLGLFLGSSPLSGCSFLDDFDKFHAEGAGTGDGDEDAGVPPGDGAVGNPKDAAKDATAVVDAGGTVVDAGEPGVVDSGVARDSAVDAGPQGVCGDGVIDSARGETCDDRNQVAGDGCEPGTCTATPTPTCAGKVCSDNDPCTVDGCDPVAIECTYRVIDGDGDGYSPGFCRPGSGHKGGDCNDGSAAINPEATEICDGVDNNCDTRREVDEGLVKLKCYPDSDHDGFANLNGTGVTACECGPGRIAVNDPSDRTKHDCYDDADGGDDVHPGQIMAFERGYGRNGVRSFDYDCDGDEQPLYKSLPAGGCQGLLVLCVGESGFDSMAPVCGESGRFSVCTELQVGCGGTSETRKQLCN